jgi:hypothetical protein
VGWMPAGPVSVDGVPEERARSPRPALVLLCALLVVDFADRQVVVTTFPYQRAEFALSETQLGALVSAVSVVVAALATVAGLGVVAGVALWCGARFYREIGCGSGSLPRRGRGLVVLKRLERDRLYVEACEAGDDPV